MIYLVIGIAIGFILNKLIRLIRIYVETNRLENCLNRINSKTLQQAFGTTAWYVTENYEVKSVATDKLRSVCHKDMTFKEFVQNVVFATEQEALSYVERFNEIMVRSGLFPDFNETLADGFKDNWYEESEETNE